MAFRPAFRPARSHSNRAVPRVRRFLAAGVSALLIASGLVVGLVAAPAAAAPAAPPVNTADVQLTAKVDDSILAADDTTVTLTAKNSGSSDYFNAAFRYELPVGVSYVPGSSKATAALPDPTIVTITDPKTGDKHQVLIWSNVADIPTGDAVNLSFDLTSTLPVGATIQGAADVYTQSDARLIPKFDSTGNAASGTFDATDHADPDLTHLNAIKVTKAEPDPEQELMRGVHDKTTTYTITIADTKAGDTDDVTVVDYLPAGLEFLGCGDGDNSTAGTTEYPDAPRLGGADGGSNCLAPVSVQTINDRPGFEGQVFTKVTWSIPALAAGSMTTITYAAGIPLRANTMNWPSDATPAADGTDGTQGSNLDNNTGASTRQGTTNPEDGEGLTNDATATGTYQGPVAADTSTTTTSTGSTTVAASDLSIVKSVSTGGSDFGSEGTFTAGDIAHFSLLLRASEYTDDSAMTITDTIPNGLCPLVPAGTPVTGPNADNLPSDCQPAGQVTNAIITGVVANADGTFTVTMKPDAAVLAHDGRVTIGYDAFMGTSYLGTTFSGTKLQGPTVAGDDFTNHVDIAGTTTDLTADGHTTTAVTDDSDAGISSAEPTIDKKILPRPTTAGAVDCAANAGKYIDVPTDATAPTYRPGDKVCFELTVNFSASSETRNAQITDFVPVGTTFDGYEVASSSTNVPVVPVAGTEAATTPGSLPAAWKLGTTQPGGGDALYVPQGAVVTIYVSAIVNAQTTQSPKVDITANLMKYRQESTDGTVFALRDQVDYGIAPAPQLELDKAAAAVNGVPQSQAVNVPVEEGDDVDYTVDVKNIGTSANGNDFDVDAVQVWDALPTGLDCSTVVTPIQDNGACFDPGENGYPNPTKATASVIIWTLPAGNVIHAGGHYLLGYHVTMPSADLSVSTKYTNVASVVAFDSPNTDGGQSHYFPKGSYNPAHDTDGNADRADSPATVSIPDAVVTKAGVTGITDAGNDGPDQAVVGEKITYSYTVTVPAHSSVLGGKLSDSLPAGLKLTTPAPVATFQSSPQATPAALPGAFAPVAANGTLTFPSTYDNTTGTDQIFQVTLTALVDPAGPYAHLSDPTSTATNELVHNVATFTSKLADGTSVPETGSYDVHVVAPAPTLTKSVDKSKAQGGDQVTFTLKAGNGSGRPTAYDGVITDCLQAGLIFDPATGFGTAPSGTVTAAESGTGTDAGENGCALGTTKLTWTLPGTGAITAGASIPITFTATVSPDSAGLVKYTNTATLTTSTLSNGGNTPATERVLSTPSNSTTVTVMGSTTVKTVTPAAVPVGDTAAYTITVTIPKNVNFFDAAIIDTLPLGLTADASSATVTCATVAPPAADCISTLPGGPKYTLAASGAKMGWLLGNITASTVDRTITVTFTGTVGTDAVSNAAGTTLTNTAALNWNESDKGDPATAGSTFDKVDANPGKAVLTVQEPALTLAKTVTDTDGNPITTVTPGDVFRYTVTAKNANTANASPAYNVTFTDVVPAGVIATLPGTPPTGVTVLKITGQDPTTHGGGTISWRVAGPIAKNASSTLSYTGTLIDSTALTAGAEKNTATVTSYSSLADGGRVYTKNPPTATATLTPQFPHLSLAKATTGDSVAYANTPFGWTLTLTNDGKAGAQTVVATDTLPANWHYDADSAQATVAGGGTTQVNPTVTKHADGDTLVWTFGTTSGPAILAPNQKIVITLEATPTTDALTDPGVTKTDGTKVKHTNVLDAVTTDATGNDHNADGSYTGGPANAFATLNSADLVLTKTGSKGIHAGASGTGWTIDVKNDGPDPAVGPYTVTDPATELAGTGVTITGASGTGWTCTLASPGFSCVRSDTSVQPAKGESFPPITVAVTVAADAKDSTVANTATVSGAPDGTTTPTTFDPDTSNNSGSGDLPIDTEADLQIGKTLDTANPEAGSPISWTITPHNAGPSVSAKTITVTDVVPDGVTGVSATAESGWDCDATTGKPAAAGDTITCTYTANDGTMPVGDGVVPPITVAGTVLSSFTGNGISNTAKIVAGDTTDPNTGNNSATVATTNSPLPTPATLLVNKTRVAPDGDIVPGSNAVYEIQVTDQGPADARNVQVTDALPKGLHFVSKKDVTGAWTCTGDPVVVCDLSGTLSAAAGSNVAVIQLTVSTDSSLTGDVVNTATATADNADPVDSTVTGGETGQTDLAITKTHLGTDGAQGDPVVVGTSTDYTLTVTNNGPSDSPAPDADVKPITVTDTVPAGLVPTAVSGGTDWTNCQIAPAAKDGTTAVSCDLVAGLASGHAAGPITVTVDVPASRLTGQFVNTASVVGPLTDPKPENNVADDPTDVITTAAVTIDKTVTSSAPYVAGTTVDYTLAVTNAGPSDAHTLQVTDTAPAGLTVEAISGDDWTCQVATAECDRATLPVGTSTITVTARVDSAIPAGTTLTNTGTVTWIDDNGDGSHSDDGTADITTSALADLSLSKTAIDADGKQVAKETAGTQARYLLQATNNGPSAAVAPLTITDQLPAGMTFLSVENPAAWTAAAGTPDANGQKVTFTSTDAGTLASGADAAPLIVDVQLDAALPSGDLTNTADDSSPTDDPDESNNTADATVHVDPLADLSIVKTHTGEVRIGDPLAFTLAVANAGPSTATGVTVTDTLPVGLKYVDATGSDPAWSCAVTDADAKADATKDTTDVVCALTGGLAPNASAPALVVNTTVLAQSYPAVTNTATVASTTVESNPADNVSSDPVVVPPLASLVVTKTAHGTFQVGADGRYTITVTNNGPTEDPGPVTLTDALPSGMRYVSTSGDGVDCRVAGQKVSCTLDGSIAAGATVSFDIEVALLTGAYPTVTNTVVAASPTEQLPDSVLTGSATTEVKAALPVIPGTGLAATGSSVSIAGLIAALLAVMAGLAIVIVRRRRRSA